MPKLLIIILAVLILAAGGGVTVMQQMELGPFAKAIELIPEEKAAEASEREKGRGTALASQEAAATRKQNNRRGNCREG